MRAKHFVPGLGLFALAAVMLFAFGCSDDPTSSRTAGSDTDPDYIMVQDQVNTFIDSTIQFFANSFDNYNVMPDNDDDVQNHYSPMYPADIATYDYSTGWHVIYVTRSNDFFTDHITDSIQFRVDNEVVEESLGADYMHFIRNWDFVTGEAYTIYTHTNMEGVTDLVFTNLDQDRAFINGESSYLVEWNYISNDTTIAAQFEANIEVDNVGIDPVPTYGWASGCPSVGRIDMDITQTYTIETDVVSDPVQKSWHIRVTFEYGTADIRVVSGNYIWNFTREVCTVAGA